VLEVKANDNSIHLGAKKKKMKVRKAKPICILFNLFKSVHGLLINQHIRRNYTW
jgi:hypothetical protein